MGCDTTEAFASTRSRNFWESFLFSFGVGFISRIYNFIKSPQTSTISFWPYPFPFSKNFIAISKLSGTKFWEFEVKLIPFLRYIFSLFRYIPISILHFQLVYISLCYNIDLHSNSYCFHLACRSPVCNEMVVNNILSLLEKYKP